MDQYTTWLGQQREWKGSGIDLCFTCVNICNKSWCDNRTCISANLSSQTHEIPHLSQPDYRIITADLTMWTLHHPSRNGCESESNSGTTKYIARDRKMRVAILIHTDIRTYCCTVCFNVLQCYSKGYCMASVTKAFTLKGVKTIHHSTNS
jgi:hypothetical protein